MFINDSFFNLSYEAALVKCFAVNVETGSKQPMSYS